MNTEGTVRRRYAMRYSSGAPIINPEFCVSDSGQLWVSDNHSILRIGPDGRANLRLGEPPRRDRLSKLGMIQVFPDGGILAEDARSKSVHVFAPDGRWLHVCSPGKLKEEDPDLGSRSMELECGPNGGFYYEGVWFDASGTRKSLPVGFRPAKERLQPIQRHADGAWITDGWTNISVTPEGDVAILSRGRASLFDRRNTPLRTIVVPTEAGPYPDIAYDGKLVVVSGEQKLWCWEADGKPRWQADFPHPKGSNYMWRPFLTENSRTLLLFDGEAFTRLALPPV
ncbi:MAG: hypothetical protein QM758_25220 [Armatimonas sp.]